MPLTIKLLDHQTLNLNVRLRRVKTEGVALLLTTLPDSKIEFDKFSPYLKLEQTLEYSAIDEEEKYAFWTQISENVNKFLDFLGESEQTEGVTEFWCVSGDGARGFAASYALAVNIINGLPEAAAIASVVSTNSNATFDYSLICALDEILGKETKLLQLVEEYEATGLVVSPDGITYYREDS